MGDLSQILFMFDRNMNCILATKQAFTSPVSIAACFPSFQCMFKPQTMKKRQAWKMEDLNMEGINEDGLKPFL